MQLTGVSCLKPGDARVFSYVQRGIEAQGFLLRTPSGNLVAYANRCPHWEIDLDMDDGDFLDERYQAIMCKNHGALFDPDTGLCLHGPCRGAYLERFGVVPDGDGDRVAIFVPPPVVIR